MLSVSFDNRIKCARIHLIRIKGIRMTSTKSTSLPPPFAAPRTKTTTMECTRTTLPRTASRPLQPATFTPLHHSRMSVAPPPPIIAPPFLLSTAVPPRCRLRPQRVPDTPRDSLPSTTPRTTSLTLLKCALPFTQADASHVSRRSSPPWPRRRRMRRKRIP